MRLARKLFLLAVMAVVAWLSMTVVASAQMEIVDEAAGEHCGTLQLTSAHTVEGGCEIEFESEGEVPLYANVPGVGVILLSNCEVHLTVRVGEDGQGYVTDAILSGHPSPSFPCTRTPCDEPSPSHEELLWPFALSESAGTETGEATFCIRPVSSSEGEGNTLCTVHAEGINLGNHEYELAGVGGEAHCEPGTLPFDVWLGLVAAEQEEGSEGRFEAVH